MVTTMFSRGQHELRVQPADSLSSLNMKRLSYNKHPRDGQAAQKVLNRILQYYYQKGFLTASIDSVRIDSASTMAWLHTGNIYATSAISPGNADPLILRQSGYKEKYYSGEGRVEGDEGDNIEHTKDLDDSVETRPKYTTAGGRTVYGGGGITPDYIVKSDTIGFLARKLRAKNLYWKTADAIMKARGNDLRETYGENLSKFLPEFTTSDKDISILKRFADEEEIEWKDDEYQVDESYLRTIIKAYVGRNIFNNNGFTATILSIDNQAQKALELFPEASKIAQLN